MDKLMTLKDLRAWVNMAQGGPEIPAHVLAFLPGAVERTGDALVLVSAERTEFA